MAVWSHLAGKLQVECTDVHIQLVGAPEEEREVDVDETTERESKYTLASYRGRRPLAASVDIRHDRIEASKSKMQPNVIWFGKQTLILKSNEKAKLQKRIAWPPSEDGLVKQREAKQYEAQFNTLFALHTNRAGQPPRFCCRRRHL